MKKYLNFIFSIAIATTAICGVALWKGMDSFLFAWVLNFMLMMCLLAFTKAVQPRLKSSYFTLKKWEREGETFKIFGVNIFRKLLVWVGWEKLNKKENPVKKSPEALRNLEYATRQSEFGHLVIFIIVMIFTFFIAMKFGIGNAIWLLILNFILNLYPIMVQRYNRPRFQRLLTRKPGK